MASLFNPSSIERKEPVLVKPCEPTPLDFLSLSAIDNDPNIELICQTVYVYRANEEDTASRPYQNGKSDSHTHLPQSDPVAVIKVALSKILVYYYPLAGKLKRYEDCKLRVNCTGEGVPFMVAKASCTLSSLNFLNGSDVPTVKEFVFKALEVDNDNGSHPLVIQVTQFACGGFTLGMGLSHSISDGFGAAQFVRAMGELASGLSEPSMKPVWERGRLGAPPTSQPIMNMGLLATSPPLPTSDLLHESFNVGAECIRKLREALIKESSNEGRNENFTTVEVLGAYVWRSRVRALELNLNENAQFSLAVGIRNLLNPPLSEGYYGNAFVGAHTLLGVRELCEGPLSSVARLIKEIKKSASKVEYIWSYIGIMEKFNQQNKKKEATGASMVLTDWRHMGLFEVDFGWKESVNVVPVPFEMFGYVDLCIFMPPFRLDPSMKGGVRVLVCLPRVSMVNFKEEMDALELREYKV